MKESAQKHKRLALWMYIFNLPSAGVVLAGLPPQARPTQLVPAKGGRSSRKESFLKAPCSRMKRFGFCLVGFALMLYINEKVLALTALESDRTRTKE